MGIQGLLPFLKKSSREAHLRDFKGQTAVVDIYCWLHKGAFSCADKLVRGEPTNGYVVYVMKLIDLLLNNNIRPILVFDGCHLPSKAVTEKKRRENREKNKKKAKELLREGKVREARECFQRCVDVTSEMAFEVISACRARNVDIIVAPYEADAQLAYLNQCGIAQLVITEDSDLVLFGCNAVLFKMDSNGGCVLVESEKLHLSMNVPRDKFCFTKFRNMCILSGCDYLPSLHGIGLAKACKFFMVTSNTDVYNVLCKLPAYLKMPHLEVSKEYRDGFVKAINTFLHQLVFDPITRRLIPLTEYPDDKGPDDYPYAGKFIGHGRALQIALGNINVQTGVTIDDFDPATHQPKYSDRHKYGDITNHASIWGGNNKSVPATPLGPVTPSIMSHSKLTTIAREITVTTPVFKKRESEVAEVDSDTIEDELASMYSQPEKRIKMEATFPGSSTDTTTGENPSLLSEQLLPLERIEDRETEIKTENSLHTHTSPLSVNPFAKSHTTSKPKVPSRSQFSALKKFSKMRRTVVDQTTIVQSRYFASPVVKTSKETGDESKSVDERPTPDQTKSVFSIIEEDISQKPEESDKEDSSPHHTAAPLSLLDRDFHSNKTKTFKWTKMSNMSSCSKTIAMKTSSACKDTFKSVTPEVNSEELKENQVVSQETSQDPQSSQELSSQVSFISNVDFLDNESFGLTPTSLPSTTEVGYQTPSIEKKFTFRQTQFNSQQKSKKIGLAKQSKCRAPGLSKLNSKTKASLGPKQRSLTDMFGFKKDDRKLAAVRPVL